MSEKQSTETKTWKIVQSTERKMFLRKLQKRIFGYLPVYAEFPEDHRIRKEIIYRIVAVNETK